MKRRAVFLDRDGVINSVFMRAGKARAPQTLEQFEFLPGVKEAIKALKNAGFLTIVVTNQPDVARGWQTKDVVDAMNAKVVTDLQVDDLKVCFHTAAHDCLCRKPKPGMILDAAASLNIDLSISYMIGDRYSDIAAGKLAGCTSLLVGAGDAADPDHTPEKVVIPAAQVGSLLEASQWIVKKELDLAVLRDFR